MKNCNKHNTTQQIPMLRTWIIKAWKALIPNEKKNTSKQTGVFQQVVIKNYEEL